MYCTKCGALVNEKDRFCGKCGATVERQQQQRFCPVCGSKMENTQPFCPNCGTRWEERDPFIQEKTGTGSEASASNDIIKYYLDTSYSKGTASALKVKPCTIVLTRTGIEIFKDGLRYWGGMVGMMVANSIEKSIMESGARRGNPSVAFSYRDIVQMSPGKYGFNNTIVFTLCDGSIYTIYVGKNQEEMLEIIRNNR